MPPVPASHLALALALVLAGSPAALPAQEADSPAVVAQLPGTERTEAAGARQAVAARAATAPVLDGRADDAVWREAQRITAFRQFEPVEDGEPLFPTEARVAYDERNLYVFVRAFDPRPDSIVALLSRRDVRTESDQIKIMIDSYHDKRTGYEFAVNPAGVKRDYYMYGDGNEDDSWDAVWDVATAIDSLGWTAEFRIPLSQIRFAEKAAHTFGFGIWRDIARSAQRVSWPVYRRSRPGLSSQLGEITGIRGISTGRRLEVSPYVVTKNVSRQGTGGDWAHPQEHSAGADLKYGVTSNLTLDATINPDFGQVEADPAEFNLSATESFFGERRPFFLEGTGIFNFDLSCNDGSCSGLFYSRRIGRAPSLRGAFHEDPEAPDVTTILGAAKLTGRLERGLSVGVLNAVTQREVERATGTGDEATIEPMSNYFVGRLQQDFREGKSGVGLMLTSVNRRLDEFTEDLFRRNAYALGIDARHRFAENYELTGYLVASHVEGTAAAIAETQTCGGFGGCVHNYARPDDDIEYDPTRTALRGASMQLYLARVGGDRVRFSTGYTRTTPGFEINDVGYLSRDDMQSYGNWLQVRWQEPRDWYRRVFVNFNQWTSATTGGLLTDLGGNINAHAELKNRWWLHAGSTLNGWAPTYCDRHCTRGGPALRQERGDFSVWGGFETDPREPIAFQLMSYQARGDGGRSRGWDVSPGLGFRVANGVQGHLSAFYNRNTNDAQFHSKQEDDAGITHYTIARLEQRTAGFTARVDVTMTPTLSLQFYGQPFVTTGDFSDWREIDEPRAARYEDRFRPFLRDHDEDPTTPAIQDDPGGFDFKQFRSNAVLRWEYRPGSALFLVWAHGRTGGGEFERFDLRRDFSALFREFHPENTFLVKFSYWMNP